MCGILGVHRRWQDDPGRFDAALAAMAWRGADGTGQEVAGPWRLGVARLTITDPIAPQPLRCPATGCVAVFNGNDTLAHEDRAAFGPARTGNDGELLLLRFARDPARLAPRGGHGAGAVVDPGSGSIWLFRDPCGEKPLYVLAEGDQPVAFASTTAALNLLLAGRGVGLDRRRLSQLVRFGFYGGPVLCDPVPRGPLRLVHSLGGVWHGGEPPVGTADRATRQPLPKGRAAEQAAVREVLADAASRCARAEVSVALSLSGGVDSACIAAALVERGIRLPAYQFRGEVDGAAADGSERRRAEAVAEHLGLDLVAVDGGSELLAALPRLTAAVGLPLGDPSVLAVHALARAVRRNGHKVLLSGEGADEYWFGYRRHRLGQYLRRRWWPFCGKRGGDIGTGQPARIRRALCAADPYAALLAVAPPGFLSAVYEGVESVDFDVVIESGGGRRRALQRMSRVDRALYLRWDLLPKLDTATLAAGVEGRCPFLDPEVRSLADRLAAVPEAMVGKQHFKRAFAPLLPKGFTRQRKVGFAVPVDGWLRGDQNLLLDLLRDRRTLERPHLRPGGVARMLDLHRRQQADLGHALYLVGAVELWLRDGGALCPQ